MQKQEQIKSGEIPQTTNLQKAQQPLLMIVIKKEREKEYDQETNNRWKEARSHFFNQTIKQKLSQAQILQQHQNEIAQLFMQAKYDRLEKRLNIDLNKLGELREHQQQIKQLNQQFFLINQQFSLKLHTTPAIVQIIQLKLTQLKVISIQYSLNIHQQYRYKVSAFELFKVVHDNKGLSSVTLKGVLVIKFKQFLRVMSQSKLNQAQEQKKKEWDWMKNFKPSKSLKLAINTQDRFYFNCFNINKHICAIKDLLAFGRMLQQISLIQVVIEFYDCQWKILMTALKLLQEQSIKIKINFSEGAYSGQVFTVLLQKLSFLTTITQLQFTYIQLQPQVGINRFLAMEQILSTLFQNNKVTHLKLFYCSNFPIFPAITTIQAINLSNTTFRRQFNFMSELAQSSPFLSSIKCSSIEQEWRIEEQLFNQLQRLNIYQCRKVSVDDVGKSPSKIKYLQIHKSNIGNMDNLSVLFPKLANITQLVLFYIDCCHQIICSIPSPHLVYLRIKGNRQLGDKDLEAIDKKWPSLRQLTLQEIKNDSLGACELKGLITLQIDNIALPDRKVLRGRGIKIN